MCVCVYFGLCTRKNRFTPPLHEKKIQILKVCVQFDNQDESHCNFVFPPEPDGLFMFFFCWKIIWPLVMLKHSETKWIPLLIIDLYFEIILHNVHHSHITFLILVLCRIIIIIHREKAINFRELKQAKKYYEINRLK